MSHNGRRYLDAQAARKVRIVTVVRPDYDKRKHGEIKLSDYIDVPRMNTIGTFTLMDMLDHDSVVNTITVYNAIKGPIKSSPVGKRPVKRTVKREPGLITVTEFA